MSLSYKLVIGCSLILLVSLSSTFYIINERQQQLIIRQAENEARAIFQQIVIMRRWIADHGGVFVEQLPWAQEGPPAQPESVSSEARRYARKTPAMVTKELVSYAREKELYWFHITSLQLTNPENFPDEFERAALLRFEDEPLQEIIAMEEMDRVAYLRYISPLYVEEACLSCHSGYEVGGVRGAISVTLPLGKIFAEAKANRNLMFGVMLLLVIFLSSTLLFFLRRMVLIPVDELTTSIRHFSEKGPPPGAIVRSGDEFEELSRSFEEMAASLSDYQQGLEDKIRNATAELQHLNQQIYTASERKSEFLARAAHELRTPLTSIKGAMEYITARLKQKTTTTASPPDDLLEFFEIAQKNTDRLIRMVQTMLDIEYIETGAERALNLTQVNLVDIINESIQSFTYDAAHHRLDLCPLPPDLPHIEADEDRLRQVLTNLLGNAVKFAGEGTAITVCAGAKEDVIQVKVCNLGKSIPMEQREKVFERFYRSGDKGGSGLGLAICRAIISAHGGTIGITDPDAGSGVCVYFTLPLHSHNKE
ncbi:sensor histidine kinase [Pelovirga terrestris]|nr:ATP-binding protein [Pelovirga terrestris]